MFMMIDLIIIIAFLTSLILLILLRPIAFKLKLLDFPTKRKDHIGNVPLIGGICIYFGVIMSYGILNQHDKFSLVLLITSTFILIQGVWDDCSNVKAKYKMALQGILTVIVIYITDVKLQSFDNLFGQDCFTEADYGTFDVVCCADSLLHSQDKAKMSADVTKLLNKGGIFYISDILKNAASTEEQLKPINDRFGGKMYVNMGHRAEYEEVLGTGLEKIWVDY